MSDLTREESARKVQSDGQADFRIGQACYFGHDVEQDYSKAHHYFHLALTSHVTAANYYLGLMYRKGLGCDASIPMAYEYFSKGYENGDLLCLLEMSRIKCGSMDHQERISGIYLYEEFLKRFREMGHDTPYEKHIYASVCQELAMQYRSSTILNRFERYFELHLEAAQHGMSDSYVRVAECFEFGTGVAASIETALHYYRIASEKNVAEGHFRLLCYARDFRKRELYRSVLGKLRALALTGETSSMEYMRRIYRDGMGTGKNMAEARYWEHRLGVHHG